MKPNPLSPDLEFENATFADILDGLHTLTGRHGQGVIVPAPGDGPDKPLGWALQEVANAAQKTLSEERDQLCTNAILNSRRALACLVGWYIERDLGRLCKNPPATPRQQADFLVRRGIIDDLTSRVLERAIEKRNRAEHEYVSPPLDTAEDVVELLRRTIAAIHTQSEPSHGPWIFGSFQHSLSWSETGCYVEFNGWTDPLFVLSRFGHCPWIGLVIPDDHSKATVRWLSLRKLSAEELTRVLSLAEQRFDRPSSFSDVASCELLAKKMGLFEIDLSSNQPLEATR